MAVGMGFSPDWVDRQTLDRISRLFRAYAKIEREKAEAMRKAVANAPKARRRGRR